MKLTIVIPALNEEDAIGPIIERCLTARATIIAGSPVDDVEIIAVSDGSTDRTVEVAAGFDEVHLIVFEHNRGYGAAIKKGFEEGSGEIVAFLDADGTCNPDFFAPLCAALVDEHASIAIGSRLGSGSKMPPIRRLGNRLYALILSALSNRPVTDTASGMRVIRRDVLRQLYPLPDGLNFTPAMSARALTDDSLKIIELPMPYKERVGESKLHVVRDGMRFLRTIFEMTLMWRPARLFFATALTCLGLMALLAMHPIEMWLRLGHLEEDMIYRLMFCSLLGTFGVSLLSAGLLSRLLHGLLEDPPRPRTFLDVALDRVYCFTGFAVQAAVALPLLLWLVGSGVWTRITEGHVYLHWSRIVLAGLITFALGQNLVTILIANILRFHTSRKQRLLQSASTERAVTRSPDLNIPIPPPRARRKPKRDRKGA